MIKGIISVNKLTTGQSNTTEAVYDKQETTITLVSETSTMVSDQTKEPEFQDGDKTDISEETTTTSFDTFDIFTDTT